MWLDYTFKQFARAGSTFYRLGELALANRRSHIRLDQGTYPETISLTTHGARLKQVHFTIESLAGQAPIQLWLDAADYDAPWPDTLKRLVDRGLFVGRSSGDFGPHTKYWPAFHQARGRVITVDDDMLYPSWFVRGLVNAAARHPDRTVTAYRAHRIGLDYRVARAGADFAAAPGVVPATVPAIAPYVTWTPVRDTVPSIRNFATGVSGVLYPESFISAARELGTAFQEVSPRADDVWLHRVALDSGHKIAQVFRQPEGFAVVPSAQLSGLVLGNTFGGGNDAQIAAVYDTQAVERLLAAT